MTRTFTIERGQKPTDKQMEEIREAQKHPVICDEDAPELSPALYKAFKSSVIQRNRRQKA